MHGAALPLGSLGELDGPRPGRGRCEQVRRAAGDRGRAEEGAGAEEEGRPQAQEEVKKDKKPGKQPGKKHKLKHKKKKDAFPICSLPPPTPKVLHRVKKTVKKMEAAGVAPTFPCP